ncbi:MAG: hypothetical protein FJ267_13180 [Planctomycetes bacterium]|nr:hypothetical protein [Planctomycetota bacterium]
MFRFVEFAGDGRILFRWRWTSTPEQRMTEFSSKGVEEPVLASLTEIHESDSPSYRGTDRTGRFIVPNLSLDWSVHEPRELWRHPVGRGWSSFAVVGEFCVTQEQRGSHEVVVCYELRTGKEVWKHLNETRFEEVTGGPGPRATPAIHAGRVYTFGATGILNCLNGTDGRVIWSHDFAQGRPPLFGYTSSPLIHGDCVFITPGGKAGSIVAIDIDTGNVIWSPDSRKPGYSSPQLFLTKDDEQILVFDAVGLHGYNVTSGERYWTFPWGDDSDDQVNVCMPVTLPVLTDAEPTRHQVLISSGYGRGIALLSVRRSKSGEWSANEVWRAKTLKSKFSDVIVHEGHAYGLDEGILTCISLLDGVRRWKNGRYGYGQLILVNETLLVQTESGRIVLVKTDPNNFTEVASLDALHERTWNQPVVAGHYLLVRNDREAVCFELPRLRQADLETTSADEQ